MEGEGDKFSYHISCTKDQMEVASIGEAEETTSAARTTPASGSWPVMTGASLWAPTSRRGRGIRDEPLVFLVPDEGLLREAGKRGFAITQRGFVCRATSELPMSEVSWSRLTAADMVWMTDGMLFADDDQIAQLSDADDVLEDLR